MDGWMTPGARPRSLVPSNARVVSSRLVLSRLFVSFPSRVTRRRGDPSSVVIHSSPTPTRVRVVVVVVVVVVAPRSRPRLARSLDGRVVTAYATFAHANTASATYAVVLPGGRRRDRTCASAIARRVASSSAGSRSRVASHGVSTTDVDVDDARARRGGVRVRVRVRVGVVGDARGG